MFLSYLISIEGELGCTGNHCSLPHTGESCCVLPASTAAASRAEAPPAQAVGLSPSSSPSTKPLCPLSIIPWWHKEAPNFCHQMCWQAPAPPSPGGGREQLSLPVTQPLLGGRIRGTNEIHPHPLLLPLQPSLTPAFKTIAK